ncbi:hypothetical protein KC8_11300 [Sphingomonas sp. KC8]|nr:hypothetical protein KC8_11300 [Sphingomonas sp. KC8]
MASGITGPLLTARMPQGVRASFCMRRQNRVHLKNRVNLSTKG